jgi:cytochrome P450
MVTDVLHPVPAVRAPLPPTLPSKGWLTLLREMREDPLGLIMRSRGEVGDSVLLKFGPVRAIFLYNPEDIQQVLTANHSNYIKATRGYKVLRQLLGFGLLTSDGEFWKRQRRIAQPAFHRKSIAGFHHVFVGESERMAREWAARTDPETPVDVADEMNHLTLRIAAKTLFGADVDEDTVGEALRVILGRFHDLASSALPAGHLLPTLENYRFFRAKRSLKGIVRRIIAKRRKRPAGETDLLALFMGAHDEETGESMTDAQLQDEVLTMLLAGHETTANVLSWTLLLLSRHPEVARKVRDEIEREVAGPTPTLEELPRLTYLSQVLKETMRLYPPAWMIGRYAVEEDKIGGKRIPKGAYVYMSQYANHRDARYWPNPEAFDPERFAEGMDAERPRYAYYPFSGGQRKCIGDHFAQMEALAIVACLFRGHDFHLDPAHAVEMEPSVTLRPKGGLLMRVASR